jgi:exodeoxyribonuclease V gamma subunit
VTLFGQALFTVYHSNQLDTLKILLVHLIRSERLDDPFEAEQILVQSSGMAHWLKMELAKEQGVAANLEFTLPATFIWRLFSDVLGDVPQRSAFNKEAMVWRLMRLLPKMIEQSEFAPLRHYLEDDDAELKQYQLAEKIADIFDGYLVYRPDWIESWESGTLVGSETLHPWQPILWQCLYRDTIASGQSYHHRANLYQQLIERLCRSDATPTSLPKRVFIFGISALPPRYIDALKALSEHIDIHLMLTNPCQYYWGEIRDRKYLTRIDNLRRKPYAYRGDQLVCGSGVSPLKGSVEANTEDILHVEQAIGNSLLASMGKLGRDHLYLLSQTETEEYEFFIDIPRDTLLHQIQADILHLEEHQDDQHLTSSTHKQAITEDDRSLSLHVCYSPMREVEVLHDALLSLFDADDRLKPRDIIVMVPDINAYSPAIEAVFGNAPAERFIPFAISDRTADRESPILHAFMKLVQLPRSRCLASELLELLETPAIMTRFELSESDFSSAKQWVEQSGIRWGLDGQTALELGLPKTQQNTWEFGIQRMLAGYAMSEQAGLFEPGDQPIAPYNEVQGIAAELAGKLSAFIGKIRYYRQALCQSRLIDDWRDLLHALLDDFFMVSVTEEITFHTIRETLIDFKQRLEDACYQQPISPEIMVQCLNAELFNTRVSQRFLAGQVNFCTLMPMRSIPFKVVCLLGMNDDVYPRSVPAEGFDLMSVQHRPGDRSRRDDDRYLFLEALLSAKSRLYISYVGRSIRDNSTCQPSVLVAELMEYCHQNYCLSGDELSGCDVSGERLVAHLTQIHPMVPYSPDAFLQYPGSYAKEWLPAASEIRKNGTGQVIQTPSYNDRIILRDYLADMVLPLELDFAELHRFWRLPVQYFFNRRLQVVFDDPMSDVHDDEPFALNGLESYQLLEELVDLLLQTQQEEAEMELQTERFMKAKRARGQLPVGPFGELEFNKHYETARALAETLSGLCRQTVDEIEINYCVSGGSESQSIRLVGWVARCYSTGLVRYRVGRIRAQDYLAAWLDHLAVAVMGQSSPTHLIGYERKNGVRHFVFAPIEDVLQAKIWLEELIQLYIQGMNAPLPYFPATALAGVEAGFNRKGEWQVDEEKSSQKMQEAFRGSEFTYGEGSNIYIARMWPQWSESLGRELTRYSSLVLQTPRLWVKAYEDIASEFPS